jgi:cytoskeletal protein RodZ
VDREELGRRLRAAREAKGLSLRDVQAELKIRQRYLEAIEAGDWSEIPGAAYARAFTRTYARYLGVEADLSAVGDEAPPATPAPSPATPRAEPVGAESLPPRPRRRAAGAAGPRRTLARPGRLVGLVVAVLLLAALAAVASHRSHPPAARTVSQRTGGGRASTGRTSGGPKPGRAKKGGGAARAAGGYTVVSQSADRATVAAAAPAAVTLTFTGPCWVATTVDGATTAGLTYQAGARLVFQVHGQASFVLGWPGHVEVTVGGKTYPTSGATPLTLTVLAH